VYPFTGYNTSNRFERAKFRVASSRLNRLDVAPKKFAPSANAVAPVAPMNTRRGDTGAMFDADADVDADGNDGAAARRTVSASATSSAFSFSASSLNAFGRRPPRFTVPTPSREVTDTLRACLSVPRSIDDRRIAGEVTGIGEVIDVGIKCRIECARSHAHSHTSRERARRRTQRLDLGDEGRRR
jgi:hypothetical protein